MNELVLFNSKYLSTKSIDSFISTVSSYKSISHEETINLFKEYELSNDISVLEPVVLSNLKLVVGIALKIKRKVANINASDLIQAGCIGLLSAIKNFNYKLKVQFSTHSYFYIKAEVFKYLQENFSFFKFITKGEIKVFFNYREVSKRLISKDSLSDADYAEISELLNVTQHDIDNVLKKCTPELIILHIKMMKK